MVRHQWGPGRLLYTAQVLELVGCRHVARRKSTRLAPASGWRVRAFTHVRASPPMTPRTRFGVRVKFNGLPVRLGRGKAWWRARASQLEHMRRLRRKDNEALDLEAWELSPATDAETPVFLSDDTLPERFTGIRFRLACDVNPLQS